MKELIKEGRKRSRAREKRMLKSFV